ncbi:hypothetical protein HPB52_007237 [Rhipicephalus sanguineus]|uniref:Peptidase M13 N-terminal domain-containing protein n=1 Tax=Rhipicephalus sanguineus TaxID=34632 RepID=A0A9D4SVU6_RHISA|nr:hypothetical protein HPB52_007237 [Rhipicephalus sanguineus]
MYPRHKVHPETGATAHAAGPHRNATPTASTQPRLAGKLRRGKLPVVNFYEDELFRRAAREYAAKGAIENEKLMPNHRTERAINTKADSASPTPKSRQARNERIAAERARTDPSFANYYPGWQPYTMECPHERGEMDRCHKDYSHMWHAQWPAYYYSTDAFEPVTFQAPMQEHLEAEKSDSDENESPRRSTPRNVESSSAIAGACVSGSGPAKEKTMRPKSKAGSYKSSLPSANQSGRAASKDDDSDDSEEDAYSPRCSVPHKDVKDRPHAASLKSLTRNGTRRPTDDQSSSDDSENTNAERQERRTTSAKSTSAKSRAASRGTSKSSAATGSKIAGARIEPHGRSQTDVPSSLKLKSTKGSNSSFDENLPKDNPDSDQNKAKSGSGSFAEAQGASRSRRKTSALESRITRKSESKPEQSHYSEKSSGDREEPAKDDRGDAKGTAKSRQRTVSMERGSSCGPSKVPAREPRNIGRSESKSFHSKSSEKNGECDLESQEHSIPEKPEDIRSRKSSANRNSQDVSHEPRPGFVSGGDEKAAEVPGVSAELDKSHADLAKITPSVHSASECPTSTSDAGSMSSHPKSQSLSDVIASACTAAETSDPETWAHSTCSILTLANQVSAELAQTQVELIANRTFCESPKGRNDEAADDKALLADDKAPLADNTQMPPNQSGTDTINVTRQDSIPHVRQLGGDPPVAIRQELCLYPLSLILVVAACAVALLLFAPPKAKRRDFVDELPEICSSSYCLRDSAYLSELLNWNFDPCENFYMFVCSRWRNQFPATDSVSADDDYISSLESEIRSLLEDEPLGSYAVVGPLQDLYNKCVNSKLIEDSGWDGLLEFMSEFYLDGFPLTPPVRSSVSIWKIAARLLRKTGAVALFGVGASSHPTITSKDLISVGKPDTFTAIDGVDINDAIRLYTSVVFAAFKALRKEFIPPVHTLNVIKFASEVEKLSLQFSDSDASIETLVNASALQVFLFELFDGVSGSACTVPGCEVLLQPPEFITKLMVLVQETDLHTVMNFLGVRLMVQVAPFIPQSGLAEAYATLLYGKWRQADLRWRLCVRVVEKALPPLFHRVSLERLTAQVPTEQFTGLVRDIVAEFLSDVSTAPYFDGVARGAIQKIVSKTRFVTLAPAWIFNKTLIGEYAQRIPPTASERPLQSYAAVHEYNLVSSLTRPTYERWARSIFTTNCWYERRPRSIYVPTLLFNVTLLLDDRDYNFQLSRAGVRVSHCLLDMLFAEAYSTDPEERWLNEATVAKIAEAQHCFGNDNGPRQMRDSMAIRFAYGHFVRALKPRARAMSFHLGPRQNVSASQMFFVYLMLQSCEKKTSRDEASSKLGVSWNAALRYQGAFPKEFRCPLGSSMNSDKHCNI